ncbi:hypothetical protein ACH5RR_010068 [Cinchona calisaya]|uniref:ENTH domain-containing protein n=1 Tax=Cinchona calisaya TaxID=153742 RepID=A0ABD3AFY4_9GENT
MSSILGSNSGNMGSPFFHEFKKQASFFLKEKIKTARLALTDVTPAQLLVEEATNGNPGAPETRILKMISRAAFEIDDYWRIVEILHKRLASFDTKNWRVPYKALIVLEHLLTHGPERVSEEFQDDKDVIRETESFQHIDEKGFNWGMNVRKKSERILKLLDNRPFLKEERNRVRMVTRGIEGFGSFSNRTSSDQGVLQDFSLKSYAKCNSQFNEHGNQEHRIPLFDDSARTSFKENMIPKGEVYADELDEWDTAEESNALLSEQKADSRMINMSVEDDHPFNRNEHLNSVSLLSSTDRFLRAF